MLEKKQYMEKNSTSPFVFGKTRMKTFLRCYRGIFLTRSFITIPFLVSVLREILALFFHALTRYGTCLICRMLQLKFYEHAPYGMDSYPNSIYLANRDCIEISRTLILLTVPLWLTRTTCSSLSPSSVKQIQDYCY